MPALPIATTFTWTAAASSGAAWDNSANWSPSGSSFPAQGGVGVISAGTITFTGTSETITAATTLQVTGSASLVVSQGSLTQGGVIEVGNGTTPGAILRLTSPDFSPLVNDGTIVVLPGNTASFGIQLDSDSLGTIEVTGSSGTPTELILTGGTDYGIANNLVAVSGLSGVPASAVADIGVPDLGSIYSVTSGTIIFDDGTERAATGDTFTFGDDAGLLEVRSDAFGGFLLPIAGFQAGDTIDVAGSISAGSTPIVSFDGAETSATLALTTGGTTAPFDFTFTGDYASQPTALTFAAVTLGGAAYTQITTAVVCFAAGTRIATATASAAVEALAPGDMVRTASGALRPVTWVGMRAVEIASHRHPLAAMPVRVQAGAFGENRPARDLYLSPEHGVFAHGVLVPVRCLANGSTIASVWRDRITYFHVELDAHDIILAEGLPVESYLDCGNRETFANAAAPLPPPRNWAEHGCAELVEAGAKLDAIRARIDARARDLGLPPAAEVPPIPDWRALAA